MSIYKYVHEDRIDILENLQIRFTQPQEFNDPFEMYPYFQHLLPNDFIENAMNNQSEAEYEKNYLEGIPKDFKSLLPDSLWLTLGKSFRPLLEPMVKQFFNYGLDEIAKGINISFPTSLNNTIGVLCCATHPLDVRMWGHYANSHKGMVIVFDENHSFFQQTGHEAEDIRKIRKVKYLDERPIISTLLSINFEDLFFIKSKHWEYEGEWRTIRPLKEADKVINKNNQEIYLFNIPPDCIEGVIFGVRTPYDIINKVLEIFRNNKSFVNPIFMQTILHESRFEFDHKIIEQ